MKLLTTVTNQSRGGARNAVFSNPFRSKYDGCKKEMANLDARSLKLVTERLPHGRYKRSYCFSCICRIGSSLFYWTESEISILLRLEAKPQFACRQHWYRTTNCILFLASRLRPPAGLGRLTDSTECCVLSDCFHLIYLTSWAWR